MDVAAPLSESKSGTSFGSNPPSRHVSLIEHLRSSSNRPRTSAVLPHHRSKTPCRTLTASFSGDPRSLAKKKSQQGYTRNQRLNSLLTCQQDFGRAVAQVQSQFAQQRDFFRFYRVHSKVSASYIDSAWRAREQKRRDSQKPQLRSEYGELPRSKTAAGALGPERVAPPTCEISVAHPEMEGEGLADFSEFLARAQDEAAGTCENIEHAFNVEHVVATVLISTYT